MAVSTLLGQARAGDALAIARLMNQQLQSRGLAVKASRELDCLRLYLEGETLLSRDGFTNYVVHALGRLGCPLIARVEVVAVELGESQPLWRAAVTLPAGPPSRETSSQPSLLQREPAMAGGGPSGRQPRQTSRQASRQASAASAGRSRVGVAPLEALPIARERAVEQGPQVRVAPMARPDGDAYDLPLADEAGFEADVAAIAGLAPSPDAQDTLATEPYPTPNHASSRPRLPMPSRAAIARQWLLAGLLGTLAALGITAGVSALCIPVVASMTGMAELSGFALAILLALQLILGIPIAGLMIGYAQTRMLRRYLKTVGGWQLITPLGCLMGFFLAVIVHFVGHSALNLAGYADSLGQTEGGMAQFLSIACTTLGVGFGFGFLGLSQFAILTGRIPQARRWIVSNGFSGMVAWLMGGLSFQLLSPHLEDWARLVNMTPLLLSFVLSAVLAWLVFQTMTALSLANLLHTRDRRTARS